MRIYPGNAPPPLAVTIDFAAGQTRSNSTLVALPSDGSGRLEAQATSGQPVQLILDVMGYFQ